MGTWWLKDQEPRSARLAAPFQPSWSWGPVLLCVSQAGDKASRCVLTGTHNSTPIKKIKK